MKSSLLTKVEVALRNLNKVQADLSEYGACDSEPYGVKEQALIDAYRGKPYVALTAEQWQLYTCTKKCGTASRRLNAAMKKVCDLVLNTKISERESVGESLNEVMYYANDGWYIED